MNTEAIIRKWSAIPFRWGDGDCCQFAGEFVEALTGKNPMRFFDYKNKREALELVYRYGSLEAAITSVFGQPIELDQAKDGDVVLINLPRADAMVGIRHHDRLIVRTEHGVTDWPCRYANKVWSIL